jgi:hypothetical protein
MQIVNNLILAPPPTVKLHLFACNGWYMTTEAPRHQGVEDTPPTSNSISSDGTPMVKMSTLSTQVNPQLTQHWHILMGTEGVTTVAVDFALTAT